MTNEEQITYLQNELVCVARAIADGTAGKIHAIKAYRSGTGAGLKESKDWVEARALASKGAEDGRIQRLEDRVHRLEQARLADHPIARTLIDGITPANRHGEIR